MRRREAFLARRGRLARRAPGGAGGGGGRPGGAGAARSCPRRRSWTVRCDRHQRRERGCGSWWSRSRPTKDGPLRVRLQPPITQRRNRRPSRGGPLPEALPRRQARGPHRRQPGSASTRARYWRNGPVLNKRDQREWTRRSGTSRDARRGCRLPAPRRQVPRGGGLLRATRAARRSPRSSTTPGPTWRGAFATWRVQVGVPGMAGYGSRRASRRSPRCTRPRCSSRGLHAPRAAAPRGGPQGARRRGGAPPRRPRARLPHPGLGFCKEVERFRLFFLEDPVSAEDIAWFALIRQQCATPLAMGSSSTAPTSGSPSSRSGSSTTSGSTSRRREASRRAGRWPRSPSTSG